LTVVLALVAGCGLPGDGEVQTVESEAVPYRLLESGPPSGVGSGDGPVPRLVPVVFWLVGEDRVAPAASAGSCTDAPEELVGRLLAELAGGPGEDARAAGRSTALPPETSLEVVEIADGIAHVELSPGAAISADRLPIAVGQVVLSVTSSPEVVRVVFRTSGEAVQVPLPGGALTTRPVSADDYSVLVPDRYRDPDAAGGLSASIGCPAP
jgi:hypothetical protein